ncbi:MAG: type II toxin-antitoxin system antitoxin DNA ADP-ribosyl glycohydrolase DarG [Fimbriimonas sp.]
MVEVKVGDLLASDSQTLTNTVNCVGVMGKGIALQFKGRFPDMFRDYVQRCERGEVRLGQPYLFRSLIGPWVLNFPTKQHWRGVANLSEIVAGLEYLKAHYKEWGISSIAMPPLGCGNGQLEWNVVGPTLYRNLSELEIPVELYAPAGTPEAELSHEFLGGLFAANEATTVPKVDPQFISPAHVALVAALDCLVRLPYQSPVGRVMFQKLAYFATELGLPTGLKFVKGSYGPYSDELKRVVGRLMANGLVIEEQKGRMIAVVPGPTYKDALAAYRDQLNEWNPYMRSLIDLFARMRTDDAELAASVHFACQILAKGDREVTEREVFDWIQDWKRRRRPLIDSTKLADTVRGLNLLGWVRLTPSLDLPVTDDGLMYT